MTNPQVSSLALNHNGVLVFPERMTHVEVAPLSQQVLGQCPAQGEWLLDLSPVKIIDSACLALLLAVLRKAVSCKVSLKIKALPENAIALLKVYGIYDLFKETLA